MTASASTVAIPAQRPSADGWLTLTEAAALLGVHANTLRRWADRASIRSYRTVGGHRRLAAGDVYAMARPEAPTPDLAAGSSLLDGDAVSVIEAALRGELSERESRLRLRTIGRDAGAAARDAGQNTAETITSHLPIRNAIAEVVTGVRHAAGIGRSEVDEREWSDALADAFLFGLVESATPAVSRVRGGDRRPAAVSASRRGPPQ